jgi:hypothetical protein
MADSRWLSLRDTASSQVTVRIILVRPSSSGRLRDIRQSVLTALFTTCGMSLTTFVIAAVVSLPKQFVGVYLGYALRNTDNQSRLDKIIKFGTIAITIVITIFAAKYMKSKQTAVKDQVVYERRKRRQAKIGGTPVMISNMPSGGDVEQGRYEERVPLSATDYQKVHNPAAAGSYPPTYGQ